MLSTEIKQINQPFKQKTIMSQKVELRKNESPKSLGCGNYYWHAAYEEHFVETEELADFIQMQASIKRSDIKATLDELGAAIKHYLELGQKIRLDGIGIFKVGVSSKGMSDAKKMSVDDITKRRVLFLPETVMVKSVTRTGEVTKMHVKTLVRDVVFEESRSYTSDRKAKDKTNENGED